MNNLGALLFPTNQPHLLHHPSTTTLPTTTTLRHRRSLLHCSATFNNPRVTLEKQQGSKSNSFYDLLGISEEGSVDEIKKAYKQLARKYHPDVSPKECAEEYTRRFIEVQEAYETLSDPGRRAMYDRDLYLAFSNRGRRFDKDMDQKSQWRNRWQDQVEELKWQSIRKESEENLSWGARMRRQRAQMSTE